jgi:predicted branched-subunit amino acid permease
VSEQATRASVIRDSIGVAVATGTYGLSFGAVSVTSGFTVWQTCALSLLVFTGASQFALVGVVASGGNPLSGALSAILLGTRNTLYGLRVAPLLGLRGWRRAVHAHALIDESTAMSIAQPTSALARTGFLTTGWAIFGLWNAATLLGAVGGDAIGDPRTYGLDAAVGAAFLALLWSRLTGPTERVAALAAAALALGLVPVTTPGVPVLAAVAVALVLGARRRAQR